MITETLMAMLIVGDEDSEGEGDGDGNGEQGGITCGAIDEPKKSSKAIDKRVIINFRNKNVVVACFCDKNEVFVLFIDIYVLVYISFIYI